MIDFVKNDWVIEPRFKFLDTKNPGEWCNYTKLEYIPIQLKIQSKYYQPVLLTIPILEKNGWEIISEFPDQFKLQHPKVKFNGLKYYGTKDLSISISGQIVPIKYVHELQHVLRFVGLSELANNFKI